MFENLIAGSVEPELLKVLRLAQTGLGEVRLRQLSAANSSDHITALVATQMLVQIDAWGAALDVMIGGLVPKTTPAPHANPLPQPHR